MMAAAKNIVNPTDSSMIHSYLILIYNALPLSSLLDKHLHTLSCAISTFSSDAIFGFYIKVRISPYLVVKITLKQWRKEVIWGNLLMVLYYPAYSVILVFSAHASKHSH